MRQGIRSKLTYANVVATLALFLVIGGGTALASYVVSNNSQVGPNTIAGHKPYPGQHANIIPGSINGQDVATNSLTGADIANHGVDACTQGTVRRGALCVRVTNKNHNWSDAMFVCADLDLRLPTPGEALALANNHTLLGSGVNFWTDEAYFSGGDERARAVNGDGSGLSFIADLFASNPEATVCVTDPSA